MKYNLFSLIAVLIALLFSVNSSAQTTGANTVLSNDSFESQLLNPTSENSALDAAKKMVEAAALKAASVTNDGLSTNNKPANAGAIKPAQFFTLNNAKQKLEDFISKKTNSKKIRLSNIKVSRVGSGKNFTLKQAISAKIADRFKVMSANFSGDKFSGVLEQEQNKYSLNIEADISKSVKVPVLSENIGKETVIEQDMLEFKQVSEAKVTSDTITNISDVMGVVASKNLARGRLLKFSDIKKPILVKKNDVIHAVYQKKNMELKLLAVAQNNAAEGDIIRLKNYDSGVMFEGKINGKGQAIIFEGGVND